MIYFCLQLLCISCFSCCYILCMCFCINNFYAMMEKIKSRVRKINVNSTKLNAALGYVNYP